jgi:hypothetical protein
MADELHSGTASGLLRFLDYCAEKGLINAKTAGARKSACTKVLEIDGPKWREQLITDIDPEDQLNRFSRLSGVKYSPGSLATYGQRFRDAVSDYSQFLANPTGYRGQRPRQRARTTRTQSAVTPSTGSQARRTDPPAATDSSLITYPFPLGAGTLGYVQLPRELSTDDVERLCHFIRSLAIGDRSASNRGPA